MNYLADTHILIWAIKDDPKLSVKSREILLNKDNMIYYSFANVWEFQACLYVGNIEICR